MNIFQINGTVNTTSTGRITEQIGHTAIMNGHISHIAASNIGPDGSTSHLIKIGGLFDRYIHGLKTRVFDLHGFGSKKATKILIDQMNEINPDVIGLHNLHGYYLNIELLFKYLKKIQKPVIWTLFDCWAFTGHCTYFDSIGCERWISGCHTCPKKTNYPASYVLDNSIYNYEKKRELFNGLNDLVIVTHSEWLKNLTEKSFLGGYPVKLIRSGVDINTFRTRNDERPSQIRDVKKPIILGVASVWDERKGLKDFIKLHSILNNKYQIVLVGLNESQMKEIPEGIIGISRTENVSQLAQFYSSADIFINPTWQDNFPTTNLEALACGTPVATYNSGGSPEAIDSETGFVVLKGDIEGLKKATDKVVKNGKEHYRDKCRMRAVSHFNKDDRFKDYLTLYEGLNKRAAHS